MNRQLDIFLSCSGLVLLLPIFLLIALLVRIILGPPVLFRQVRPGRHGNPFVMYKFRTMTNKQDDLGKLLADNQRLTHFGKFLRATSLDELPTIVNVIKGEMSLVGPRPLLMEYLPLYSSEQARRHEVLPGVTGWAQVNGRNTISWEKKFEYDLWYIDNRSFWLDIKILWMTFIKVFKREGINQVGHATMKNFKGSNKEPEE